MVRFLLKFWPVLIPLLVYTTWYLLVRAKAKRQGAPLPKFRDGPIYWTVVAMLATGVLCFVAEGLSVDPSKGEYIPSHMEDGVLKPGTVTP